MNTARRFLFSFVAWIASAVVASADTTKWNGSSTITFSGSSTLHDWSGTVSAEPFVARVSTNAVGEPAALVAKVEIKAVGMDTAEPARDVKMRKSMKVTDHPLIVGVMDATFDKINGPDGKPATLPFTLTLVGKTHQIAASVSHWSRCGDSVSFDLDFDLSLKACGIEVPSVLFVVRVDDTIKVHAPVKLVLAH